MSDNIEKVKDPADPQRCQAMAGSQGQCMNKAAKADDGSYSDFCLAHGGNQHIKKQNQDAIRNYQLNKFKSQLNRHAGSSSLKSLRDEIAILRMIMEERLNLCRDESDLVLNSGAISDLVLKIDKLVTSCHKLEGSMGQLLDKSSMLQFASEIIDIVGNSVTNIDEVEEVGNKIMGVVGRIGEDKGQ